MPGGHRNLIRAKSGSPDGKLVPHRVYTRRPGPASEESKTAEEWAGCLAGAPKLEGGTVGGDALHHGRRIPTLQLRRMGNRSDWLVRAYRDSNCPIRPRATQLDLRDNFARGRRKSGGGDPSCASCATTVWPLRLGSVFGRMPVRDPIHDAVSEGDAIDGLGKTPIIDQVDKP